MHYAPTLDSRRPGPAPAASGADAPIPPWQGALALGTPADVPAAPKTDAASLEGGIRLARRPQPAWTGRLALGAGRTLHCLALLLFLALPLAAILMRALSGPDGQGLGTLARIVLADEFLAMAGRSLAVGATATAIVVPLAYAFAYGLSRTLLPGKSMWRLIALLPLLAPSLLPGISLVYLFGNQGLLRPWMGDASLYGFWGIVAGEVFYTFPHALMILLTGLSLADARLYDAARAMGSGPLRTFLTVTLPGTRYAVFSACCLVFTLVVTDFGVPKVVGGSYNVLAMEAYKAVVGQMDFTRGAAIGLLLLAPALLTFAIDAHLRKRQSGALSGKAQPYAPGPNRLRDGIFLGVLTLAAVFLLALVGVAVWASFIQFWPYNLSLSLRSYDFDNMDGGGWLAWRNSVRMALLAAIAGTVLVYTGAWMMERLPAQGPGRALNGLLRMLALTPMAVPGLVLGLGYIFFFNAPGNPLGGLYGTMTLLVLCTVVHFYSSAHLTAVTALRGLDREFEAASASLKVPGASTFLRVTLPMCLPAVLDTARYLFVSAMTTVSAVVFLYSPDTVLAAVAVLNMDDAGFIGPAAAMCTLIMATSAVAALLLHLASRAALARTQAWRRAAR